MGNSNHQTEETTYGGEAFAPFEFDEEVAPDLAEGLYTMEISDIKYRIGNPDKVTGVRYPQLVVEWKATDTSEDGEDCRRSVGNTVSEFLTFRPTGDRKGNMTRQRLTLLRNKFGVDSSSVPTRITSQSDFNDLRSALKGQTANMRATNKIDNTGAMRTNLAFADDEEGGGEEEQQEERQAAPPPRSNTKAKPAAKPAAAKPKAKR